MRRGERGEGRNPKPEGRKKAEIRSPNGPRHPVSVFGFRNSAFFRPSTFGLRPSKLPHPTAPVEMLPRTGGGAEDLRLGVKAVTRTRSFPSASTN